MQGKLSHTFCIALGLHLLIEVRGTGAIAGGNSGVREALCKRIRPLESDVQTVLEWSGVALPCKVEARLNP